MAVKIKEIKAPQGDLSAFDPGEYISHLEFYESNSKISESDRAGLAELLHYLAYIALNNESSEWVTSSINKNSSAFKAIDSHFSHLSGWENLSNNDENVSYKSVVTFLMPYYKPGSGNHA